MQLPSQYMHCPDLNVGRPRRIFQLSRANALLRNQFFLDSHYCLLMVTQLVRRNRFVNLMFDQTERLFKTD